MLFFALQVGPNANFARKLIHTAIRRLALPCSTYAVHGRADLRAAVTKLRSSFTLLILHNLRKEQLTTGDII